MIWSFSESRIFRKCQRQWFYKACCASARSQDPARREAYLLSKLQSISAWRGQIVDTVVEQVLVPALNQGNRPMLNEVLATARMIFEKQLAFGRQHRVRNPGFKVTEAGDSFAAFYAVEYGNGISDIEAAAAWADVEKALRNLFGLIEFKNLLRTAKYRIAQRSLLFEHAGAKVRAVPDLIAFFADRPPVIVDWKVHTFGVRDYRDQLLTYAIALMRAKPHRDFPSNLNCWKEFDVELIEVQLLRGVIRRHSVEEADVQATDQRIAESIVTLQLARGGQEDEKLSADDFPAAFEPRTCQTCPYRKLCWN
jgi:hypothetical protein